MVYIIKTSIQVNKQIQEEADKGLVGKPADILLRIAAFFIDWFLFQISDEALSYLFPFISYKTTSTGSGFNSTIYISATYLFYLLYKIYFEYHYGQTIGKNLAGIKVTGQDGSSLAIKKVVFRNLIFILAMPLAGLAASKPLFEKFSSFSLNEQYFMIPILVYMLIWLANIFSFVIDNSGKTFHDELGKSVVVKVADKSSYFWWVIVLLVILSNVVEWLNE